MIIELTNDKGGDDECVDKNWLVEVCSNNRW